MHLLRLLFVLLTFASTLLPAQSQESPAAPKTVVSVENADRLFATWEKDAQGLEARLQNEEVTTEALAEFRAALDPQRISARALADQAKAQLAPLIAQLEALGPAPEEGATEDPAVALERSELNKRIASLRAVVSKADLAYTRADRLIASATEAQRARFTDRLLQHGPAPVDPRHWLTAGRSLAAVARDAVAEATTPEARISRATLWAERGPMALAALAFAFIMLVFVRRYALHRLARAIQAHSPGEIDAETEMSAFGGLDAHETLTRATATDMERPAPALGHPPSRTRRLIVGVGTTLTRLLMPIAALLAARYALDLLGLLGPTGRILVDGISLGLVFVAATYAFGFAFFAPDAPELRLANLSDDTARSASLNVMIVAVALALNIGLVGAGERIGLSEAALAVYNLCTVLLASWGLWGMAKVLGEPRPSTRPVVEGEEAKAADERWLADNLVLAGRRGAYLLAVVTPLTAVAGYYALSRHLLQSGILSAAVIATAVILFLVAREAYAALRETTHEEPQAGGQPEKDDAVGLFPVFIAFVLALATIPVLALVWGATTGDLQEAWYGLT